MNPSRVPAVKAPEYWKHARPYTKRRFWKRVRRLTRLRLRRGED